MDAFKSAWSTGGFGPLEEAKLQMGSLGLVGGVNDDEWNYGSCEGDALVLITATV